MKCKVDQLFINKLMNPTTNFYSSDDKIDNPSLNGKKRVKGMKLLCIGLAVIWFVLLLLATMISIMGVMKTVSVGVLLDMEQEENKNNREYSNANIEKLNSSLDKENAYSAFFLIATAFGIQLSCAGLILLYGVFMNKVNAIYSWIMFSMTNVSCLAIMIFLLGKYTKLPIDGSQLQASIELFILLTFIFNVLLYYYAKEISQKRIKIVKSFALTHTISNPRIDKP